MVLAVRNSVSWLSCTQDADLGSTQLSLLLLTSYLRTRPTSLIGMATLAHFASPLATDLLQYALHFVYSTSSYPLILLESAALYVSRRVVLVYFIRQDLSFDCVLEGNFP